MNKKVITTIVALLLIIIFSLPNAGAEESKTKGGIMPTTPKATVILQSVGDDFIVAQERTFAVTKDTVIKDKKGNSIPLYRLVVKKKIELEYIFTANSVSPIATSIKMK